MKFLKYLIDGQEWTITRRYGLNGNGPYFRGYTLVDGKRVTRYFGKVDPRLTAPSVEHEHILIPNKHKLSSKKQAS